jgi:hypothetical protein
MKSISETTLWERFHAKVLNKFMLELFEFEVRVKDDGVSDEYAARFIKNFLDVNSLFWGGGYDPEKLQGTIATENDKININRVIEGFVDYFNPHDEISIKVYHRCFNSVDARRLCHSNLDLTMIENPK